MKERKSFITENTIINIDEKVFKENAENLICEMFIEYINEKYGAEVVERKLFKKI